MSQNFVPSIQHRRPRNNHGQEEFRARTSFNNSNNYEDSNSVFITAAAAVSEEDLGFEFEEAQQLPLENTIKGVKVVSTGGEVIKVDMDPFTMSPVAIFSSDDNKNPRLQNAATDTRQVVTNQIESAELTVQSRRKQAISIREIVLPGGSESESDDSSENTSSLDIEEIDVSSPSCAADAYYEFEDTEPMPASASLVSSSSVVEQKMQQGRFPCDSNGCNARFPTAIRLKRHKLTHSGERPFICDWPECKQRFAWKHNLVSHVRFHTSQKPYICNWPHCGKRYSRNDYLTLHQKSHTGEEKPFGCAYCGRRFNGRFRLITHERIHTGEKPFICKLVECGKRFTTSSGLMKHEKIHTGEKTFICNLPVCGKKFGTRSSLVRHGKTHTGK